MDPHQADTAPSPWIVRFADDVPVGEAVLDLACGGGRHGRLFEARGHPVCYLDRDTSAVADRAGAAGVEIVSGDLEDGGPFPLAGRRFGAVVVVNYLHRPLLPALVEAVAPGGLLLYDTFMQGNEAHGRPRNPAFLLAPGELRELAQDGFAVLDYQEGTFHEPAPAVKQRLAARRL